jgi:hypothetical protein
MKAVVAVRSRFFACLAFFLLATVGVVAVEHCHCDDVTADCEHAGEVCAQPDDCSDCLVPSDPAALVDAPVALLPPANVLVALALRVQVFAYSQRCAGESVRPNFISIPFTCRPPALRAGTMCLRV